MSYHTPEIRQDHPRTCWNMSNRACAARSTDTRTWPALGAKRRSPPRGNSTPAHPRQPGPKLPRRRSGPTRHRGASRAVSSCERPYPVDWNTSTRC
ncbi:hypothetical protein T02_8244 [Trichinella nativa]|uniref:Uncharacterized protein n=1 Tax=Trichinella nativa TaxID=6335 RepID=A0A0V1LQT6_9BILA|nr:hypothetical protein T02_8244 [Trichinella nativa]